VTGFEFRLTLRPLKKIKHLPMQKNEKRGRISANLQPHATSMRGGLFGRHGYQRGNPLPSLDCTHQTYGPLIKG
jgi:hypothetical protein